MPSLDDETCIECGICVDLLPQYFEVVEGSVRVRPDCPEPADEDSLRALGEAIRDCPSGSLRP
jgi:ferredoxin